MLQEEKIKNTSCSDSSTVKKQWYALYVRSNYESIIEQKLNEKGIETFVPKRSVKKKWSDRTKYVKEPIFKSYCFSKFLINDRLKVLSEKGVVGLVHFGQTYVPIDESVIFALKTVLENNIKMDPYPYLNKGDRIVIKRGPLKGIEGFLIKKIKDNTQVVISIDAIASSISYVIDSDFIDRQ